MVKYMKNIYSVCGGVYVCLCVYVCHALISSKDNMDFKLFLHKI